MSTVRALSADERAAFARARLVAVEHGPYLAHALFAVAPLAAPGLGTFAVDAHWRLYLAPERLIGDTAWTPSEAGAVLLHEVGHLVRDHAARAAALPAQPYHHESWNLAGDAAINADLLAAGVPLPAGAVTPEALGCPDGWTAEDYYAAIAPPPGTGSPSGSGEDELGCGSGAGCPVPGELPADTAAADGAGAPMSDAEATMIRRRVAHDVTEAATKGRGSVPAGMRRWAEQTLTAPTVPWTRVLRAAVRRAVADRAGRTDYTYRRPARRRTPGVIRPAMRAPSLTVAVVIDTSGSMSQADLDAALSELRGVLTASGVARDRLRLIDCDATVGTVRRVRTGPVTLAGGGGTDMRVGIATAQALTPEPDVIVVLTDGFTPWPDTPPRGLLVCAIIGTTTPPDTPHWARTVTITRPPDPPPGHRHHPAPHPQTSVPTTPAPPCGRAGAVPSLGRGLVSGVGGTVRHEQTEQTGSDQPGQGGVVMDEAFADFAGGLLAGTRIDVADVAAVAAGQRVVDGPGRVAAAALRDGWAAAQSARRGVAS